MRVFCSPAVSGALAVATAFALDQATKALALANVGSLVGGLAIAPGFNLVLVRNSGVSFGMLGDMPWWAIALFALAVCCWLTMLMLRSPSRREAIGYGLIIGGALGNIMDRARLGGVIDFLDFYVGRAHWPAFNLADAMIFCGVGLMLWAQLLGVRGKGGAS
jgi:signal peptidase II